MKKSKIIIPVLLFIVLTACGQTKSILTGAITNVHTYNMQYAMTVDNTNIVLIVDLKDTTGTSFEINKKYKDLLVKRDGKFELNPKYARKKFKVTYYVNGKGWKCIKKVEIVK